MICNPIISHGRMNLCSPADRPSPCKYHPTFGGPCPLLHKDKMNDYCGNCGPRGMGFADCWNPLEYVPRPPVLTTPNSFSNLSECDMPGCDIRTNRKYCKKCQSRRNNRKGQWKRLGNDGKAPEWFLNRPVDKKQPRCKPKEDVKYHPDDYPHRAIIDYKSKLEKANSLGFKSFKEMTTTIYQKTLLT